MSIHVIAVTGAVGSGKSTVCTILQKHNFKLIDADQVNHFLLTQKKLIKAISSVFGETVLDKEGNINNKELGNKAFSSKNSLKKLTDLLYPEIKIELKKQIRELLHNNSSRIVLEAPTLFEADCQDLADYIITIESADQNIKERTVRTRDWAADEAAKREKLLLGRDHRVRNSDYVILNDGSIEELEIKIKDLLNKIV
ncbi:MAG: dephospho-CoA kinase [Planctomycetota bacterium]|jgi:dephospho-CoA kinase